MVDRPFAFHCIHLEYPGAWPCLVNILAQLTYKKKILNHLYPTQSKKPTKVIKPFSIDNLGSVFFYLMLNIIFFELNIE